MRAVAEKGYGLACCDESENTEAAERAERQKSDRPTKASERR